jgi:hypothetical protein
MCPLYRFMTALVSAVHPSQPLTRLLVALPRPIAHLFLHTQANRFTLLALRLASVQKFSLQVDTSPIFSLQQKKNIDSRRLVSV